MLCCKRLGEHSQGDNHNEAIGLLAKVDRGHAKALAILLGLKTPASYGAGRSTADDGSAQGVRRTVSWRLRGRRPEPGRSAVTLGRGCGLACGYGDHGGYGQNAGDGPGTLHGMDDQRT